SRVTSAAVLERIPFEIEGDRDLVTVLTRVFETSRGQIEIDALVEIVAQVWHIPPDPVKALDDVDLDGIPAPWHDTESAIDQQRFAKRLWEEIRILPRRQRVALLLNLRDGRGNSALALFPITGVAAFSDVARVLELSQQELAEAWPGLPLEDNR